MSVVYGLIDQYREQNGSELDYGVIAEWLLDQVPGSSTAEHRRLALVGAQREVGDRMHKLRPSTNGTGRAPAPSGRWNEAAKTQTDLENFYLESADKYVLDCSLTELAAEAERCAGYKQAYSVREDQFRKAVRAVRRAKVTTLRDLPRGQVRGIFNV